MPYSCGFMCGGRHWNFFNSEANVCVKCGFWVQPADLGYIAEQIRPVKGHWLLRVEQKGPRENGQKT